MPVEKNDVDISRLFNWGKEFKVTDSKDNLLVTVYVRLVGDSELNRSRVFALRKSAELRNKLNNPESEESVAFIPHINSIEKDKLVETTLIYFLRDLSKEASDAVDIPFPKEPDTDAPLEDHEKYQAEVDSYPKRREDLYKKKLDELIDKKRKELSKLETNKVYHEFKVRVINEQCENEMMRRFNEMNTFFGIYLDEKYKTRAFKTFEEFDNLPPEIKTKFVTFYSRLDIDAENLKK